MKSVKHIERVYYLITALFWLSTAIPLALLVLIHQARGLNVLQVGLLMGSYSLTIVLLEVPTGGLADAIGRKRVALLAATFSLASGILFLFAFSMLVFLPAWILSGIGRALSSGALDAWFVDALKEAEPELDIQPSLARAGTVTLLTLGGGTLLGGLIPRFFSGLPAEGTAVLTPLSMTVLFAGTLKVIEIVTIYFLVQEDRPAADLAGWRRGFRQVPVIVREAFTLSRQNPTVLLLLAVSLASGLGLATVETFWQPRFAGLLGGAEGNSLLFGAIMAGSFLLGAVGNRASIPLSRILKRRYGLLAGLLQGVQGAMLLLMAIQTKALPAAIFFWLVYFSMGALNSPLATLINDEIPTERRSSMLSVQSLATYAGVILGSSGLGFVAERAGIGVAWIMAGAVLLVSLFLYLNVDSRRSVAARRSRQVEQHDPETAVL
jgi:MFS family permease